MHACMHNNNKRNPWANRKPEVGSWKELTSGVETKKTKKEEEEEEEEEEEGGPHHMMPPLPIVLLCLLLHRNDMRER